MLTHQPWGSKWLETREGLSLGHWRQKSGATQVLPFCDSTLDQS